MLQDDSFFYKVKELSINAICWIAIIVILATCVEVVNLIESFFRAKHPKVEYVKYEIDNSFIEELEDVIGSRDRNYSDILDEIEELIENEKIRQIEKAEAQQEEFYESEADRYVW